MTDGWVETTLGEVASLTIGRTPPRKASRFWTDDLALPFCTIADMDGWSLNPAREGVTPLAEAEGKAKRVPAGSLLMSFKLTIGRVGFAARDVFPNEAIVWIDPSTTDLDVRYLAYWLDAQDLSEGSGRAVKGSTLNSASLRSIRVAFPPRAVQRRIVDLMGHLDTHLANLETERDAAEDSYLAAIDEAFNDGGAERVPLGDAVGRSGGRLVDGDWIESKDQSAQGIRLLQLADIARGAFLNKSRRFVSAETFARLNCTAVECGDLVISRMADPIGRTAPVPKELEGSIVAVDVAILSPGAGLDEDFLLGLLNSSSWIHACETLATGTTRIRVSRRNMATIPVPMPTIAEQREVGATFKVIRRTVDALSDELAVLRDLRLVLLGTLLSRASEIPESYDELLGVG